MNIVDSEVDTEQTKEFVPLPLHHIHSMDEYLASYGGLLGKRAIEALEPLHIPGRDPLPNFGDLGGTLFDCQAHVVAAASKMMDERGSGFIVGEMGVGKTPLGLAGVHKHAQQPRNKGGRGGNYRAIVLCPDHLIRKWAQHAKTWIPEATVFRFGPKGDVVAVGKTKRAKTESANESNTRKVLRDTVTLLDKGEVIRKPIYDEGCQNIIGHRRLKRWKKPKGAEWYILGRNQAKWLSEWAGIADPQKSFQNLGGPLGGVGSSAERPNSLCSKTVVVGHEEVLDAHGHAVRNPKTYTPITKPVLGRVHTCPRCGSVILDKRGKPAGAKQLTSDRNVAQKRCEAGYLKSVYDPALPQYPGGEVIYPASMRSGTLDEQGRVQSLASRPPGSEVKLWGRKWIVKQCCEPLYHYTSKPYRWAPAHIIQRKLRGMFSYLVIDELQEQKSDESGRSMACGKLIASVKHTLAMTGTIIGGYARDLYPLMIRITPESLKDQGYEWGKLKRFNETYGRIDTIITTKEDADSGSNVMGRSASMRKARGGSRTETTQVRPGVMPTMFAHHMLGTSMFLTLDELAQNLPDLFEYVGGQPPEFVPDPKWTPEELGDAQDTYDRAKAGWVEVACEMEPEQAAEYERITAVMELVNRELINRRKLSFLGAMLHTSMDYPDRPFGWEEDPDLAKAFERAKQIAQALGPEAMQAAEKLKPEHSVGYWEKPKNKQIDNWVGVVTPKSLPEDRIYPKEKALIDICKMQFKEGKQTWVYVNMTGKRDIQPRLQKLLEAEGLRVGILRASPKGPEPIDREDWIEAHGRDYDVMLSHPSLVETGLDLFSMKPGGHNYSTLVFYEEGYNLFTMRQAARRAWRIGQPDDCRIYYLYYRGTMQHRAMSLMARKLAAAQALEGQFSEDGLAALAGNDNLQMALAKSMAEHIDASDVQRHWAKINSASKKRRPGSRIDALPPEAQAEVVSDTATQLVVAAMEDSKDQPQSPEVQAEVSGALARAAEVAALKAHGTNAVITEWEDVFDEKELDDETGDEYLPELEQEPVANLAKTFFDEEELFEMTEDDGTDVPTVEVETEDREPSHRLRVVRPEEEEYTDYDRNPTPTTEEVGTWSMDRIVAFLHRLKPLP